MPLEARKVRRPSLIQHAPRLACPLTACLRVLCAAAAGPSGVRKKSSQACVERAAPGENASPQKAARVGVAGARPAMGPVAAPMPPMVATFERVVREGEAVSGPVLFARLADSLFA